MSEVFLIYRRFLEKLFFDIHSRKQHTYVKIKQNQNMLKKVLYSTSSELYNIMLRELACVGCPHWMSCQLEDSATNIFAFTLDQGPDNQGLVKFIKSLLVGKPSTMMLVTWCFMHQSHLIVKNALTLLDKCKWWSTDDLGKLDYFSAVSAIANCWRTPGNPMKIYEKGCCLFGDIAGKQYAKLIPGRVQCT